MVGLTGAICLGLVSFGDSALHAMIGRGGITAENVQTLWWTMVALAGVLVGGAVGQVTAGAFYAAGDTKTPTKFFVLTYTVYVPIKIFVFRRYGLTGLAVASSVYFMLNLVLQLIALERGWLARREWSAAT
jgi:peptidoglycan biosynthesis protein MviN/MurJ (putative lipid II flippase)